MGSIIEAVGGIVQDELDRIAQEIEAQMKAEAVGRRARVRTGAAAASIHIENSGTGSVFGQGRFVGAIATFPKDGNDGGTHLYYLDQGNGGGGRFILPTRSKALHLKDGTYAGNVRGYSGTHFIKKIADRYR